ncbi:TolC family outer membrane protein [Nereida sp.]|uniref:TolC family outer membrane protein n=1 Tax=Nereida sp. TaxID=2736090 RepID=UPI003F69C160
MFSTPRRLAYLLATAITIFSALVPQASAADSLKDALIGAYKHSGLLQQQRALLRAADEDVAQSMAALKPVIAFSAAATGTNQNFLNSFDYSASGTLSAQITLYDNNRSRLGAEAAKEAVLAGREGLVLAEQQILLRAIDAYLDVRRQRQLVALRNNNLTLLNRELRAAQDRFDVGEVTRTDVALAEARMASARGDLASAQGALSRAMAEYANAVGRKPGDLQAVKPVPSPAKSIAAAAEFAQRNHPSVKRAQREVTVAELNVARAEAAMGSTVTLKGVIGVDDDFDTIETAQIELSQPIYQGGSLSSLVRQAQARRDASLANVHVASNDVRQSVENAFADLSIGRAQIESAERQVRAAQTAFNGVREEAKLGARTTLDVLDAEQELLNARTQRISALIDERRASYGVLVAMGLLTADYLELGIQTYDPAGYYELVKDGPTKKSKQGQQLDRILKGLSK